MIDYGGRKTDLAVKKAEGELRLIYQQAAREIEEKTKEWREGHARRDAKYRQMVKDGKLSKADYEAWMRGQVFQEKQWIAKQKQIQATLLQADRAAVNIVNNGKIGVFAANANYIGYSMEHDSGIDTGFTLYDENTVARLIRDNPKILPMLPPEKAVLKDKAYTYYNRLMNRAITQGIIQGESIQDIAFRIAKTTGESSYKSAMRNARTAYTGAQNAGRIEGLHQAQALGIKVKKRWLAILDSKTRDSHQSLDGQVQEVDDPFESPLGNIMYPGDASADDPADVYNCRCTLTYVHPEYPSSMQRRDAETGEIIGDMTYREWEQWKATGEMPRKAQTATTDYVGKTAAHFTEEQREVLNKIVSDTKGPARDVWEQQVKYLDEPIQDTKPNRAYFKPTSGNDGRVHYNAREVANGDSICAPFQTHFHEYFHNIDYRLANGPYRYLSNEYKDPVTGKTFDQMLQAESLSAVKKYFENNLDKIGMGGYTYTEAMKESWSAKIVMHGFARDVNSRYSLLERADVSDIFEKFSVTHHGDAYPFGAGHGAKYAKGRGNRACEAFAEMADATFANPGALKAIKEFYPESYRMWEDMLKGAMKS